MRLLLQNPELADQATDLASLGPLEDPDLPLFERLAGHLQNNPGASLGTILGYWYGTEEGDLLARLAADETVSGVDPAREFSDVMEHLRQRVAIQAAETHLKELERLPFAELSAAQKQQYLVLLRTKTR